jgi:hypothetical protein
VFWLFGLEGNVVNDVLDGFVRGDVAELAEVSIELRFPPDDPVTDGLGLAELKLQPIILLLHHHLRVDVNGGLLETLVALARPGLLALFTPVEFRVEAGSPFILHEVRRFYALFEEPGTHHSCCQLLPEGLQFILVLQTEQVVFSGHV